MPSLTRVFFAPSAVYCILGACDVSDEHSEVAKTADDYLWFKLCQIREGDRSDSRSGENITLQHLQTLISQDYGMPKPCVSFVLIIQN